MKILILFMMLVSLCACSCSPGGSNTTTTPSPSPMETDESIKEAKDIVGEETEFGTPLVSLKMKEGKITEISIDEITANGSKKDLGEEYKMSDSAIAPWAQQVVSLEKYIVENGVEKIEVQEGKVVNEDLKSSVTIKVENYLKTVNKAIQSVK